MSSSTQVNVVNAENQIFGTASLNFDNDANYKITLSPFEQNPQYNFAYIIDISDSMSGKPLEAAKNAYISLTNSLIDSGIADVSQFAVIPFGTEAFLNAPLNATEAISAIEGLSVSGFTNFNAALEKANQFFSTVPPGAVNTAYFLSDGFSTTGGSFNKAAKALQGLANVQAYGLGAANIFELRIVDSDQPTIVSDASQLAGEFADSILSRNDIFKIDILLDGKIVETIKPEQLRKSPTGLTIEGSIDGLNSQDEQNKLTAEIFYINELPNTTVDLVVQTPQILPQSEIGNVDVPVKVEDISNAESDIGTNTDKLAVNLSSPAIEEIESDRIDGSISSSDDNETSGITLPVGETPISDRVELNELTLNPLVSAATFENNQPEYSIAVIENDDVVQNSQSVPQYAQNILDGNLLNLESFTGDIAITFTVDREAEFDNTVGFYKIEDAEGTITDPITGNKVKPGDDNYAQVAVQLHEPELELSVNNLSSTTIQDSLSGGYLYAPFIITEGNIDTLEGDFSQVYFSFAPANSDGVEHIRSLGNNTLGFEDLSNGGDRDFNDIVILVKS